MGDGYWSQSGCNVNGNTRPDVWWYGVPGQGSWYWRPGNANPGPYFVGGPIYANFAVGGYECGGAGAPTAPEIFCTGMAYTYLSSQRFEGGSFVVTLDHVGHYRAGVHSNSC